MTTGKALNGKPYAGNPHVRFDEGEVAPAATPRRGPLLYRGRSIALALAMVCTAFGTAAGEEALPKGTYSADGKIRWIDGADLPLEGRGFPDAQPLYQRMPDRLKAMTNVNRGVWIQGTCSAGLAFRFHVARSSILKVRWRLLREDHFGGNLPPIGKSGVDFYARDDKTGAWRYGCSAPPARTNGNEREFWVPSSRDVMLYLPLYNGVEKFEVGVSSNAVVTPCAPRASGIVKPVVFYGTSITQGACASRPGMAYPAIVARAVDAPHVNLGFSGSGRMEMEMADMLLEIDASCYVLDCLWNMDQKMVEQRFEPFLRRLKAVRPDVPIVTVEQCGVENRPNAKSRFIRGVVERLKATEPATWANLRHVHAEDLFPDDGEGTADRCHPNDWGAMWLARAIAREVAPLVAVPRPKMVLDFEDGRENRPLPCHRLDRMQTGVTNAFATSGANSFRFRLRKWREGEDQWPMFLLRSPVRDWRGYDRLVLDAANLDGGGDTVTLAVMGSSGRFSDGICKTFTLKPYGTARWVVPLDGWTEKTSPTNVTAIGFCVTRPEGCEVFIDSLALLKPGEPEPAAVWSAAAQAELAARRKACAAERAAKVERMKAALRRPGGAGGGLLVGQATTMEHKRPEETFALAPADILRIRLARNEHEGVQVFAVPDGRDLKGVKVSVSPLVAVHAPGGRASPRAVKVYTVGYVRTVKSPSHYRLVDGDGGTFRAPTGWWPDPLLDFVPAADVKEGNVQGFWIDVWADESLAAGTYRGTVTVSADNATAVQVPLEVRVNGFTLPKTAVMPTAISFHPPIIHTYDKVSEARKKDPRDITNVWKPHEDAWVDMAADHLISVDYLYPAVKPRFRQLMRLKEQGRLGWFNLGYWRHSDKDGVTGSDAWKRQWFGSLDAAYAKAKELGLLDHAYLYGEDEIPRKDFAKVAIAAKCMKERYPGVPLLTTAYDADLGLNGSPLAGIDWFCPLTDYYDPVKAAASRAAGHKVWWYVSNLPLTRWANVFVEKQPIETRLLMGAMVHRMQVDGFLFYAICSWKGNRQPIETGPYTAWDPVSYEDYHGCGSWIYCGPGGVPVPTIRLENYRDGLEDLAYVRLLKEKRGIDLPVPEDVMKSMTEFSLDPAPLMRWRDRLADLIENGR